MGLEIDALVIFEVQTIPPKSPHFEKNRNSIYWITKYTVLVLFYAQNFACGTKVKHRKRMKNDAGHIFEAQDNTFWIKLILQKRPI